MNIDEKLLAGARAMFDRENGVTLTDLELDNIENAGLNNIGPGEVARTILESAKSTRTTDPLLGTMIFVLGKRYDPTLKEYFVEALRRSVDVNRSATYQALIALDNLDENVFVDGGGCLDHDENRRLAIRYLENQDL